MIDGEEVTSETPERLKGLDEGTLNFDQMLSFDQKRSAMMSNTYSNPGRMSNHGSVR
jgi:hypothetical protein